MSMKTMQVGELKARFSEVMEHVKHGEDVVISYGRKHQLIAAIVPYKRYRAQHGVKLGTLQGQADVRFEADFEMSEEELLES